MKNRCLIAFVITLSFCISCSIKNEPYSILELHGVSSACNYSKSFLLYQITSDTSANPVVLEASPGDLIACDEVLFLYEGGSMGNAFTFTHTDSIEFVNGKVYSIDIPGDDNMLPWFREAKDEDLSSLEMIRFRSEMPESYLPYLKKLAEINPHPVLWYEGDFKDMDKMLDIFQPEVIAGPSLSVNDYGLLSKQASLKILLITPEDSVISDPLPPLPSLKQVYLSDIKENALITNDFFANNSQIERVIISTQGALDFALLDPLVNLRELIVSGDILNPALVNNHKKLEVLSVAGFEKRFIPDIVKLPSIRWMAFPSNVTNESFDAFIKSNPGLEVVEIISNDTIGSLKALSLLPKLNGLTITDTITDIETVKSLGNLKYLCLPAAFLDQNNNRAEIRTALPDTRLSANEGFCLGSGWLLLLIPLVIVVRYFTKTISKFRG